MLLATTTIAMEVVYHVNAGGSELPGTPTWAADTDANPSPFQTSGDRKSTVTSHAIDLSHGSLSAGTPAALFQTDRWDPASGNPMSWDFPVTPGDYEVRLYFAELWSGGHTVGGRTFDVSLEGVLVLDDYDVFAAAGAWAGVMESFVVSSDSNLDIDFAHVVNNPAIKGFEIIRLTQQNLLKPSTQLVEFADVPLGEAAEQTLPLTHAGSAGAAAITILGTSLSGAGAAEFGDSFHDAVPVTLAPGQSYPLTVRYVPASEAAAAQLTIHHDGTNSPITIDLSGSVNSIPQPPILQPVSFRAIGDTPYDESEYVGLANDLTTFAPMDEFLIHVGDIKAGAWACTEDRYSRVHDILVQSSAPVFVVPGDNEWNDCNNPDQAWNYWTTYFGEFDQNFSNNDFSVLRQAPAGELRNENFAFVHNSVLFIGVNLPGSSTSSISHLWDQLLIDNGNWVEQNFNAFGDQVTSAVVFAQAFADPTGGSRQPFGEAFVQHAQSFEKPILYLMGDSHSWRVDQPFAGAPNVTRVIVDAGPDSVRFTVTHDPNDPFQFDRDPSSAPLQASVAETPNEGTSAVVLSAQAGDATANGRDSADRFGAAPNVSMMTVRTTENGSATVNLSTPPLAFPHAVADASDGERDDTALANELTTIDPSDELLVLIDTIDGQRQLDQGLLLDRS